jgi:hypothetical protein
MVLVQQIWIRGAAAQSMFLTVRVVLIPPVKIFVMFSQRSEISKRSPDREENGQILGEQLCL